jgi:hypothetical protein
MSKYFKEISKLLPTKQELEFTKNMSDSIKNDVYILLKEKFDIDNYSRLNATDISKAKMDDTGST